jgi:phytoene dehydrogenase-like protein
LTNKDYDAVVVGSGPNGLAAAITLQQQGLSVLIVEGRKTIGGGMRTAELTLPGFKHDVCSAIHPMAVNSPFFSALPLHQLGLEYIYTPAAAAHPLDNGDAAVLKHSIKETAALLDDDADRYIALFNPLLEKWFALSYDILGPLHFPKNPLAVASFGLKALQPASWVVNKFKSPKARALWAGMAAHSILPLSHVATSAIGLVLITTAHAKGWPFPKAGTQSLADALAAYFVSIGGSIETGYYVHSLKQLPSAKAILLDTSPDQLLQIAGHRLSSLYKKQLARYRYGMGIFKIDWALDAAVPFTSELCRKAATIHLGGTYEEIADAEQRTWKGDHPEKPFVLFAQQSLFDTSRAPQGKHTAWAYCHVPNGSVKDMTAAIEQQVERFAPGFRERILAKHTMNTEQLQQYNPNYVGGDINGGVINIGQLFTRPALRLSPYKTTAKGIYLCSASTPPGGGVHGMCGYHAAKKVLKDIFKINELSST